MRKISWQDMFFLTALLAIVFGVLLGVRPLNTPDEGRYAEVAREMLFYQNFITPQINHLVFLDKPPLVYWLMAGSMKLFGINSWAVRLIPALFAWLGCVMTFFTASQLYNRRTAWLAALMLASSILYFGMAHYINMDMAIAVLISITLQSFLLAMNLPQYRHRFLYIAYVFCGLAILTKGIIGIIFPFMIIGAWIIITKKWHIIKHMCLPTGLLLVLVISVPWFALVQRANPEFLHYFFIFEQFTRYVGQQFNNPQPFWYYVPIILLGFFPWVCFLFPALKRAYLICNENTLFFLLWIAMIVVFFSIPQAKISSYIVPIFPALALLTAEYVDQCWQQKWRWPIGVYALLNSVLMVAMIFVATSTINDIDFHHAKVGLYCVATILLIAAALVVFVTNNRWRIIIMLVTSMLFLWSLLIIVPTVLKDSVQPLTKILQPLLKTGDTVVSYHEYYQDLPFYLQQKIMVVNDWTNSSLKNQDNSLGQLAWSIQYAAQGQQWMLTDKQFWQLWQCGQRVFVFTNRDQVKTFKHKSKQPVYVLAKTKYTQLLSNQNVT